VTSFKNLLLHQCDTQASSLDLTQENLNKLPMTTGDSILQGPSSIKSGSTMRSSQRHHNTSCSVSQVSGCGLSCHEESDGDHLLHLHANEDVLEAQKSSNATSQIPIPIDPIIIPQTQNMSSSAARWQRKHNKFVIESLKMQQ